MILEETETTVWQEATHLSGVMRLLEPVVEARVAQAQVVQVELRGGVVRTGTTVRLVVLDCQVNHRRSMPNTAQAVVVAAVESTQTTLER